MRLAILDDYQGCVCGLACFTRLEGHDVVDVHEALRDPEALAARLGAVEAQVLIRERTRITAALLEKLPALRRVSQTGRHGPRRQS